MSNKNRFHQAYIINFDLYNHNRLGWILPERFSNLDCKLDPRSPPWTTWRGWQSCCWKRWCCREGRRSDPCFPAPQLYLLEEKHILYYYGIFMKTWRKNMKMQCLSTALTLTVGLFWSWFWGKQKAWTLSHCNNWQLRDATKLS